MRDVILTEQANQSIVISMLDCLQLAEVLPGLARGEAGDFSIHAFDLVWPVGPRKYACQFCLWKEMLPWQAPQKLCV